MAGSGAQSGAGGARYGRPPGLSGGWPACEKVACLGEEGSLPRLGELGCQGGEGIPLGLGRGLVCAQCGQRQQGQPGGALGLGLLERLTSRGGGGQGIAGGLCYGPLDQQQLRQHDALTMALHQGERQIQLFLRLVPLLLQHQGLGEVAQGLAAPGYHPQRPVVQVGLPDLARPFVGPAPLGVSPPLEPATGRLALGEGKLIDQGTHLAGQGRHPRHLAAPDPAQGIEPEGDH